jgi:RNA polymerase sigma-70 factor (ECF subfamily)
VIVIHRETINKKIKLYEKDLSKLCIYLCRNTTEAEDLYQETWLKVIRNFHKYDIHRPFEKWLYSICINTFKNMRKTSARKHEFLFSTKEKEDICISSIPHQDIPQEDYYRLYEAISKLPHKHKVVVVLRYFKDYSEKDVAEILKIPVGTVKSRLNKAKKLLFEELK